MKSTNNISTTFGPLPIFGCDGLIVPVFAEPDSCRAVRDMLGKDAVPLHAAVAGRQVAAVESIEENSHCRFLIGVAAGDIDKVAEALDLAEQLQCRTVVLAAFGVYEVTAEACRIYNAAGENHDELVRAQRLYAGAVAAVPRVVAALRGPLTAFASQIGYVQFIDVLTSITTTAEITPQFRTIK